MCMQCTQEHLWCINSKHKAHTAQSTLWESDELRLSFLHHTANTTSRSNKSEPSSRKLRRIWCSHCGEYKDFIFSYVTPCRWSPDNSASEGNWTPVLVKFLPVTVSKYFESKCIRGNSLPYLELTLPIQNVILNFKCSGRKVYCSSFIRS
jgi:hypothetical protein